VSSTNKAKAKANPLDKLARQQPVQTVIKLLEQAQAQTRPWLDNRRLFETFLEMSLCALDPRGLAIDQAWEEMMPQQSKEKSTDGVKDGATAAATTSPSSQSLDPANQILLFTLYTRRVAEWQRIVAGLSDETMHCLTKALSVLAYHPFRFGDYQDYLGEVYMQLGQANKWAGQFFTPWPVARMMAEVNLGKEDIANWPLDKPLTVNDPCCGSGVMLLAAASVVREYNPALIERGLVELYGQDIDPTCILMARLNLRLCGLDAQSNSYRRQWLMLAASASGPVASGELAATPTTAAAASTSTQEIGADGDTGGVFELLSSSTPTPTVKLYSELSEVERERIENSTGQSVAELEQSLYLSRQLALPGFELPDAVEGDVFGIKPKLDRVKLKPASSGKVASKAKSSYRRSSPTTSKRR